MSRPSHVYMGTRLRSTGSTWGEIQTVWAVQNLAIEVQARNYDIADHLRRDHAAINLSVQTAVRIRQILGEAIEASLDVPADRSQPGLWSDATTAAIAARWGRRAAG